MTELPEEWEVAPVTGWIDPTLAEEFPGLSVVTSTIESEIGKSSPELRERLRSLSDSFTGAKAVAMREKPIPWAYRVFYRHIGLDPDTVRTPIEQLVFERIHDGGFATQGRVGDALTIATVESGVATSAFNASAVSGAVGLRLSGEGEGMVGRSAPLPVGTIVFADQRRAIGILFGTIAEDCVVPFRKKGTGRVMVAAIGVRGVPDIALEEAVWVAMSALRA
jgi:DNA/RNA-binding domain of Phe-tRNA-synthetase-like protein